VAGWPGGKNWIDSSSLMLRLRVPQILTANEMLDIRPKSDDDVMMGQMMQAGVKRMKDAVKGGTATIDWSAVNTIFEKIPREKLLENISATVLQTKSQVSNKVLEKYLNAESRENYIKSAVVNLMSTPEYQLC
jgi:6-pyruvoyl-tetrahydropterin synthase